MFWLFGAAVSIPQAVYTGDLGVRSGWWLVAGDSLCCCSFPDIVTMFLLSEVMTPVGTAGTIHYQLASLPFTSGLFLELDLDVS